MKSNAVALLAAGTLLLTSMATSWAACPNALPAADQFLATQPLSEQTKHIGQSEEALWKRIQSESDKQNVSTFKTKNDMDKAAQYVYKQKFSNIDAWWKNANKNDKSLPITVKTNMRFYGTSIRCKVPGLCSSKTPRTSYIVQTPTVSEIVITLRYLDNPNPKDNKCVLFNILANS